MKRRSFGGGVFLGEVKMLGSEMLEAGFLLGVQRHLLSMALLAVWLTSGLDLGSGSRRLDLHCCKW